MNIYSDPAKLNKTKWSEFVANHSYGNFFQSAEAFLFFSKLKNYSPFVIWAVEKDIIIGLLSGVSIREPGIKSGFSARTIIWGGPLVGNDLKIADDLLAGVNEFTKKSIYTEFRNFSSLSNLENFFVNYGYFYKPHLNYLIGLDTIENCQGRLSKSKLRQIRSSLKNGAEILVAEKEREVKEFYGILKELYKNKVKKPLPDLSFFLSFLNTPGLGKIFILKYESEIIGGILCPLFNNRIIYEWYVAGKDGQYKGIFPSVLATWAPIEYGVKHGFQYFDFLGAGSPDSDYGVREFKSKFGGELVEYGRYIKINKPLLYKLGKTALTIMAKLKRT